MSLKTESGPQASPLAGENERLGADWISLADRRLPGHYGDASPAVEDEYRAALEACALVDLCERDVVAVTGPKRIEYLQNILSNEVTDLAPGRGRLAALMNTKGHLLAVMRVMAESKRVLLELDRSCLDRTIATLEHYRVAAPVRFAPAARSCIALLGPTAPAHLGALGLPVPAEPNSHGSATVDGAEVLVVSASDLPRGSFVLHSDRSSVEPLWRRLVAGGARPMGRRAFDALRIEQGRALYGFDLSDENLLHETGFLSEYHSSSKGCYMGQEVVARLEARGGNVSRRLVGLKLSEPAAAGAEITSDGTPVGGVTTSAISPRLGPIAMGYLHRKAAEPGRRVSVAGSEASVVALPFQADAGEAG